MKVTIHTSSDGKEFEHKAEIDKMPKRFAAKSVKIVYSDGAEEKRTLDQNNALWRWDTILGKALGYTPKEMHYNMCGEIFGWYEFKGRSIPKKTTRDLSKSAWQDYVTNYEVIAGEQGVELPPFGDEE